MENKKKIFLLINSISPIVGYSISIPMILSKNYLYALPVASLVTTLLILVVFYTLNRKWFSIKKFNFKLLGEMLKIGIPLMPTFIAYWIFTSCDRLMIAKYLGNNYVGIYGIGARVASVSQFIYAAFAGGWQYFAFSTMKDKDQVELTSRIFEYLAVIALSSFMIILPFSRGIFNVFLNGDYVYGYTVFPYLFLAPLLLMLYQTVANQFLVIKKTWPSTAILFLGAMINITLNSILIKLIGIEGAAIATLLGYVLSLSVTCFVLSKINLIKISNRCKVMFVIAFINIVAWRVLAYNNILCNLIVLLITLLVYLKMFSKEVYYIVSKVSEMINKNTKKNKGDKSNERNNSSRGSGN